MKTHQIADVPETPIRNTNYYLPSQPLGHGNTKFKGHVFVVDDNQGILDILYILFIHSGYTCETYISGNLFVQEKKESIKNRSQPMCLVSDVKMPELDGLSLQKMLPDLGNIPMILMSGHCSNREIVQAFKNSIIHFLVKPFNNIEILDSIAEALAKDEISLKNEFKTKLILKRFSSCSPREKEIALLVADGLESKNIASQLDIGLRTVKLHRQRIYEKFEVNTKLEFIKEINQVRNCL